MACMPRIKGEATKIAYNILGVPSNIKAKETPEQKKRNKRLLSEETQRAR